MLFSGKNLWTNSTVFSGSLRLFNLAEWIYTPKYKPFATAVATNADDEVELGLLRWHILPKRKMLFRKYNLQIKIKLNPKKHIKTKEKELTSASHIFPPKKL